VLFQLFYYIRVIKVLYFENLLVGKLYHPIDTKKTVVLSVLIFHLFFIYIPDSSVPYQLQNDFVVALIRLHSSGL
jgi:NADH:ubiquinone oxidoreductase subunit 2 (subunit N)